MNNSYPFVFEEHPAPKGECPECREKRVFRYYKGVSKEYGRCERKNNCGYHKLPPLELLEEKEEKKKEEKGKIVFVDEKECLIRTNNTLSPIHKLLEKLHVPLSHGELWGLGTDWHDNTKACFIYRNKEGKAVNIKSIKYTPEGKRTKILFYLKPKEGERYSRCLFGEHKLSNKTVCAVESEKTAVIASYFYPDFDWVATGSDNGLTNDQIPALFGRKIYYLPDADKAGRENSSIKLLRSYQLDFEIIDLFPDRNDGYDLADAIIEGLRPEIKPAEIIEVTELTDNLGFEMTFSYQRKHSQASILYNGQNILFRGEIGVDVALPGAGKTSNVEIKAACFIASKNGLDIGIDSIKIVTGEKKALIADTERPFDDNSTSFERIARRVNIEKNRSLVKDNKFKDLDYRVFTEIATLEARKAALEQLLATDEYEFVLLDGILDFSAGLNDEKASLEAVTWLRSLASKHDCTIWVTLHPNKGTENMAGHLGAFLYRFARACLMIRPNALDKSVKEVTVDFPQGKLSHTDPTKFQPLYFRWDDELKMMMPTSQPEECEQAERADYDLEAIKEVFRSQLLLGMSKVPSAVLKTQYANKLGLREAGAKKHILSATRDGYLKPEGQGKSTKYILINDST